LADGSSKWRGWEAQIQPPAAGGNKGFSNSPVLRYTVRIIE